MMNRFDYVYTVHRFENLSFQRLLITFGREIRFKICYTLQIIRVESAHSLYLFNRKVTKTTIYIYNMFIRSISQILKFHTRLYENN